MKKMEEGEVRKREREDQNVTENEINFKFMKSSSDDFGTWCMFNLMEEWV